MKRSFQCTVCIIAFVFSTYLTAQKVTQITYLSGKGKDDMVQWEFYCSDGMNSKAWTKIGVPSCWELQGFGNYNYGRDFKFSKPYYKEYGIYKHRFFVPKSWKTRQVRIVFEGVMTDAEVKINGKLAGEKHQGAFYEFKYNITNLLKFGAENILEVKVDKWSSNASINAAERHTDFWVFGGIFRPVYLEILPSDFIDRVAIDAKANGEITAAVYSDSKKVSSVQMTLLDCNSNKIQDLNCTLKSQDGKWNVNTKALNIETWNPEKPNLYKLQINLLDKKGTLLHQVSERIGFRTVDIRESDGIYVNGKKIKFKGVNRHSFHPESGRTTSKALSIEHVKMMKDMNMNAVRMSHYPPDVHFLEVCDSLGLFVIDELCTWHVPYLDTDVGKKRIEEMIVRDVNHPSILLWANGNETGWNLNLDDEFSKWDIQKREVIHPWNSFGKMNTMHYPSYGIFAFDSPIKDKIYFPTEFLHGLYDGGHGAGLDDYWKQMWYEPLCAGGFLWDFADEGVVRTDQGGRIDTDGNHAPDGILGPYLEKEGSYYTIKEVWSPVYIEDRYIRDDFNGIFNIENRYHFTNLNACKLKAKWVVFNGPMAKKGDRTIFENEVVLPALSPGEKGNFTVEKPNNWKDADALLLTATNSHGAELFTWSYPVKTAKQINKEHISKSLAGTITTKTLNGSITIITGDYTYQFSETTGLLIKVVKDGAIIPITNGPVLLGSKSELESVQVNRHNDNIEIIGWFKKKKKYYDWEANNETTQDYFKWTVNANGVLDLHVAIRNQKTVNDYMGISFSYPETEVKSMKWLGDGPYRVWRNRMKGTQFNIWENNYNNTVTGESGYTYPEFKGFYSNLIWLHLYGKQNNGFRVYCHSDFTFLRMLTPAQPKDPVKGATVTHVPEGDISFVKNIPAIGTKFMLPSSTGPQGSESHYFGNIDEPITIKLTFEF